MTDANVLADALVEAGILRSGESPGGLVYWISGESTAGRAEYIITDWRVAGKVLESDTVHKLIYGDLGEWCVGQNLNINGDPNFFVHNESLPRAIIEAWYAARGTE